MAIYFIEVNTAWEIIANSELEAKERVIELLQRGIDNGQLIDYLEVTNTPED